ncbi:MAG: class I SAM-dependent methyltransferase [Hyphomicrobiaceae bacterium]
MSWRDYWNSDTPIYVNERHKSSHYAAIAEDTMALIAGSRERVLDFGCGEALFADRVAERVGHLYLCDGAPKVRERLASEFGGRDDVTVLAPEDLPSIPAGSIDLVVINSVVQYLDGEELGQVLAAAHRLLSPHGRLAVADVIPPSVSSASDAGALLVFAFRSGFFLAAALGLVRTVFSGYLAKRARLGLSRYTEAAFIARLAAAGFSARRRYPNMGHNQARMMFIAEHATVVAHP